MIGRGFVAALLALAAAAPAAPASQVYFRHWDSKDWTRPNPYVAEVGYQADPGEANRLRVYWSPALQRLMIQDTGSLNLRGPSLGDRGCDHLVFAVACYVSPQAGLSVLARLEDGDDRVSVELAGAPLNYEVSSAEFHGGPGQDVLTSETRRTSFVWGPGADDMHPKGDYASYDYAWTQGQAVAITFDGLYNDGTRGEGDNVRSARSGNWIRGTSQADRITGSPVADQIDGSWGNDWVDGRGGDDDLEGWVGDDILRGGPGDDILTADPSVDAQGGRDVLYGDAGADTLRSGRDGLVADQLFCGDGADFAFPDPVDTVDGDCETVEVGTK